MGTRNESNIKLLRRGAETRSSTVSGVAVEPLVSSVSSPPREVKFSSDILAQPLGRTGMVNRLHESYFPAGKNMDPLAEALTKVWDLERIGAIDSGYLDPGLSISTEGFETIRSHCLKAIDEFMTSPMFEYSANGIFRDISTAFGKYWIRMETSPTKVRLSIGDNKTDHSMGSMEYEVGNAPWFSVDPAVEFFD
jgi:hypothetical protein